MFKEVSITEAVDRLYALFFSAKMDLEALMYSVRKEVFAKKLTKKQQEKIDKEHTAILMLKADEICQKTFGEKICRKLLDKLYEKIYSFHYERKKKLRIFKLRKKRKENIEFIKFLQRRIGDYHEMMKIEDNEWPRKFVDYLDKEIFNELDYSRALTLSIGFTSSFDGYGERLINLFSGWEIKE